MIGKLVDANGDTVLVLTDERDWAGSEGFLASVLVPGEDWGPADGHPAGMLYRVRDKLRRDDLVVVLDSATEADMVASEPLDVAY